MKRMLVAAAVVLVVVCVACSNATSSSTDSTIGSPQSVAPAPMPAGGAPVITSLDARATTPCTGPSTTVTLAFTISPTTPAKYVSFAIDGRQTTARTDIAAGAAVVDGLPCDGAAHSIMLLATDAAGASDARGVAVRSPSGT